jgi:hypothetical protein
MYRWMVVPLCLCLSTGAETGWDGLTLSLNLANLLWLPSNLALLIFFTLTFLLQFLLIQECCVSFAGCQVFWLAMYCNNNLNWSFWWVLVCSWPFVRMELCVCAFRWDLLSCKYVNLSRVISVKSIWELVGNFVAERHVRLPSLFNIILVTTR